jgi:hypothetical protein
MTQRNRQRTIADSAIAVDAGGGRSLADALAEAESPELAPG